MNPQVKQEAGLPVQQVNGQPKDRYSLTQLKSEINQLLWMFAAGATTLDELDTMALQVLAIVNENQAAHGLPYYA